MAAFKKGEQRGRFLPQGTVEAMQTFAARFAGCAVLLLAILLAVALGTANPHDPSFNTVVNAPVANALGRPGAVLADLCWQIFGLASVLILLWLLMWGMRMVVRGQALRLWPLRLIFLPVLLGLATIALTAFRIPAPAISSGGSGGALGKVVVGLLLHTLPPTVENWMIGLGATVLALLSGIFVLGIGRGDLARLGRGSADLVAVSAGAAIPAALRRSAPRDPDEFDDDPPMDRPPMDRHRAEPTFDAPAEDAPADTVDIPPDMEQAEELDDDLDNSYAPPYAEPPPAAPVSHPLETPPPSSAAPAARAPVAGPAPHMIPPLSLLAPSPDQSNVRLNQDGLAQNAKLLESVLEDFGVHGKVVKVRPGPVVTLYELEPAPGTKTSRVIGLADDIARSMSALSVRIATIPGRSVIGIELPNSRRETVYLRELLASDLFDKAAGKLTLVLGKDIGGAPVMVDLARMPHLLIAGTTGSGKSVAVNTMILSLLYRLTPDECRIIMIDPKMLELSVYDGIPHLLAPVVTEPGKAVVALKWAVREMEDRYRAMSQLGVRNIAGYNQRLDEARSRGEQLTRTVQTGFDPETGKPIYEDQLLDLKALPFIVVIVDEMADLMLVAGKDIEAAVQRLAQMARAAGIHLIMATQRPSVDVITGTIKANFPTRISFQVTSKIDSRTILGEQGAEQLLGQGDMLYMAAGGRIIRVHGPFVSDVEVEKVVDFLRSQGEPNYVDAVTEDEDDTASQPTGGNAGPGDDLYDQAVALVAREGKASTSFVQRHLQIGYNRAARLIERMEQEGVVSKANHVGKREVLTRSTRDDF